MSQVRSPFKFLAPFGPEDRQNFFGRDREVQQLYRIVQRTPLLLLYGLSGTGKTSLMQCGLATRFKGPDWLPVWIRREQNINESLQRELDAKQPEPLPADTPTPEKIRRLYRHYLRPVYLLFDQFEELFILGDAEERKVFITELKAILDAGLSCTIVLIVREEYLGRLYPLEKAIPNLHDFRMRVEPMDTARVTEVISRSFSNFNISLEAPAKDRINEIIQNIRLKDAPVELPHLQVYLDRLYREDYARTYAEGIEVPEGGWPSLEFTKAEIHRFGSIENVLDGFLREQRSRIQADFDQEFPDEPEREYAIDRVLLAFVSAEGTKRPISISREGGHIQIDERQRKLFPALSGAALSWCIVQLEKAYILHSSDSGTSIELTHDALATAVEAQQDAEQRQMAKARHWIETGYKQYEETGGRYFLDQSLLFQLEPYQSKLSLPKEWAEFIVKSHAEVKRRVDAENERTRRELQLAEEKLAAEKKLADERLSAAQKARRRQWYFGLVAALAVALTVYSYFQTQEANAAKEIADRAKQEALDSAAVSRQQRVVAVTAEARAQQKADEAQRNADALAKTLFDLGKTNEQVMDNISAEARQSILKMDYAVAAAKLKSAAALGKPTTVFRQTVQEVAFFWTEAGKTDRAAALLRDTRQGTVRQTRVALRAFLKNMDAKHYRFLENRYFGDMVPIKGGAFRFGRDIEDGIEGVKASVSDFHIARTEATFWQYGLFCAANGRDIGDHAVASWGYEGHDPIIKVSWDDAVAYANWLSDLTGRQRAYARDTIRQQAVLEPGTTDLDPFGNDAAEEPFKIVWRIVPGANGYRLPTEVQWEYAARGGKEQQYAGADDVKLLGDYAWYNANSSRTKPVAGRKQNPWGLYDMSGNVWEWCWDWYDIFPEEPEKDYAGPKSGSSRVVRGGSWSNNPEICQVANRYRDYPDDRYSDVGFRLVFVP